MSQTWLVNLGTTLGILATLAGLGRWIVAPRLDRYLVGIVRTSLREELDEIDRLASEGVGLTRAVEGHGRQLARLETQVGSHTERLEQVPTMEAVLERVEKALAQMNQTLGQLSREVGELRGFQQAVQAASQDRRPG